MHRVIFISIKFSVGITMSMLVLMIIHKFFQLNFQFNTMKINKNEKWPQKTLKVFRPGRMSQDKKRLGTNVINVRYFVSIQETQYKCCF